MEVYEITGYATGVSRAGVNFLQPADAFQTIEDGFIYRQVVQSRPGFTFFATRLSGATRIFGIFEHTKPDGTTDLLAVDKNYLYKYNTGTGVFDQISFAGSMAAYGGFNISANDFYVSGVSYPTASNTERFIICGKGITANGAGSSIFFYNGTDVRDFTSVADNPNYAAPTMGALTKAEYVTWFNERLNFIIPTIGGTSYNQGVLYSGIRTSGGNGDKFNIAGSGLLQADTYEDITGVKILGQVLALNFTRSNWTLEKTTDAFNPYFIRKVPSVLGTDAKFSAVNWSDQVRSIGKTGIIFTDGRQSLRGDNKIPYFTATEIDQIDFNLTYGGFDRIYNQFLWSYLNYESGDSTQNRVLVHNYEEDSWSVYNQRFSVFGQTEVGQNLVWDDIDETTGNESWAQWDTTEEIWDRIGLGEAVQKTLAGDDLGFIYELNQGYDDYYTDISGITQANPAVLTVSSSAFQEGDQVVVAGVEGMTEINNFDPDTQNYVVENIYTVTSATPTSVTLNVDSTNFTAYTQNGRVSKPINFRAKTIPFNPYRDKGKRVYVSHIEVLIDTNGGNLLVDVFADDEEEPFLQDILLQPSNDSTKKREWVNMTVNNEANFITFLFKQNSPSVQVRITSTRIYASPGGNTNG